jgi:formylglycine-generating enzyme required for sulfatase activity
MRAGNLMSPRYDVFLSHNSADKPAVEALARKLLAAGVTPFLDKWNLVPGEPGQEALEEALDESRTCAVFLGPGKLGPWQNEEMRSSLETRVSDESFRVIPVLLPGSSEPRKAKLPRFLRRLTWVDFSAGLHDEDAFHRLISGIRGTAPGPGGKASPDRFTLHGREFIYILPGPFTLGSTDAKVRNLNEADRSEAFSRELQAHEIDLPVYYIARYPVTQAEYAAFVAATGRAVPYRDDEYSLPYAWDQQTRTHPAGKADHPVVLVSWYDAQAYCEWLGGRLPTEAEWEKAARGPEKREWPWGNVWQPGRCNSAEANLGGTSAVGRFSPHGDSSYGIADLAGNVWEWCSSRGLSYPYRPDESEDLAAEGPRVMRGGAFGLGRLKVRCAFRNWTAPDDKGFTIGFRVAFDRPPAEAAT